MTRTSWHTPCTQLGAMPWQIGVRTGDQLTLLCAAHDAQVRAIPMPWITQAVPLEPGKTGVLVGLRAVGGTKAAVSSAEPIWAAVPRVDKTAITSAGAS
ncbi:MAG TPA: hypothetical protein VGI58_05645 [Streptosporangiaceae bacterium]